MNTLISPISNFSQPRVAILTSQFNQNEASLRQAVQSAVQNQFPHAIFLNDQKGPKNQRLADKILNDYGISFYQKMKEKGSSLFLSIISAIGLQLFSLNAHSIKKELRHFIEEEKPDIIISTAPLLNGSLLEAASTDQIPVLVLPADHDSSLYSNHWPSPSSRLSPYCYAPVYSCIEITNQIHQQVDRIRIQAVGYAEAASFKKVFSSKEKKDIRIKLSLPEDKKVVLCLLEESQNSQSPLTYLHSILKSRHILNPAHYAIFCDHSHSKESSTKLLIENGFLQNENGYFVHPESEMAFSLVDKSRNTLEYMAIAHCVCTKPKSHILNQAILQNLPVLFDNTTKPSSSEQVNNHLIRQYGLGEQVLTPDEFAVKLQKMLDSNTHDAQLCAFAAFKAARPKQFQFAKNIGLITRNLLTEALTAKETVSGLSSSPRWQKCLSTAKKTLLFVAKLAFFPILILKTIFLEWFPHHLVQLGFFSAFIRTHIKQESILKHFFFSKDELKIRRQEMIKRGAIPIEDVISSNNTLLDAMRVPAKKPNPEKKTVIFILARHYQNCHPRQYEYMLQEGWDVVLFNPSKTNSISMKNDFIALVEKLRANNPAGIKLAVHGYCIGAHAAAAGGAEIAQKHPEIPPMGMILDRGFGDSNEAVENFMSLAKLPPFRNKIRAEYNLNAAEKVTEFTGKVLFTSPPSGGDDLMHRNNRNLTKELYDRFPLGNKTWYVLPDTWDEKTKQNKPATHWSSWTKTTQDVAIRFLHEYFDEEIKVNSEERLRSLA